MEHYLELEGNRTNKKVQQRTSFSANDSCPTDWNGSIGSQVTTFYISSNVSITSYSGHWISAKHGRWTRPV